MSMRSRLLLVGLLALGLVIALYAQQGDGSKDLEALQGTWRLVAGEIGGHKMTTEDLKKAKLVFKGDRYTVRRGTGPTIAGNVKLNPAANPKTIDITDAKGAYKGKTLLGIYALKGDELKECFAPPGEPRPTKFATAAGTSQFFHVWKRVKA
jgi:uncharacterized protein (TIGR03067 family)